MLCTKLCELLNIEAPVIAAPMGPEITGLELAAAVSNAGGLGMISFGGYAPQALRERIRKLRTLTSRSFGVNILLEGPHMPVPEAAFVDACIDSLAEGRLSPEMAAKAKLWTTELADRVLDECVQLHGGYGYMWEYPVARAWADARVHRIYAGTNEVMKQIISRNYLERERQG